MQNSTLARGAPLDPRYGLGPNTDHWADNQSALARLTERNSKDSEFAGNALATVDLLQKRGWTVGGL